MSSPRWTNDPVPVLLAITGASGITGWMPPLRDIIDAAHRLGVPVLADMAQLAPGRRLPADADFLVWSEYKMYAPFGDRRAVPGAVRASAGINTTDEDVQQLLAAVARVAAGDAPIPYHQDPAWVTDGGEKRHGLGRQERLR